MSVPSVYAFPPDPSKAEAKLAQKRLELAGEAQNIVMALKGQSLPSPVRWAEPSPSDERVVAVLLQD